ncbi:MAG TPA: nucleoside triphosphate pyrophosphohydrolase [bacterium]|nr:nucleoside triphosphate pyrophosphohydrolase [bacterium]
MAKGTFQELVEVMHELRQKCPWDKEQTFATLRQYVLEEAYEVADAMDSVEKEPHKLADELGDLLFQVVFQAELATEKGWFDAADCIGNIRDKLIRRHPHVFGDVKADTAGQVLKNWEAIKVDERKKGGATSAIDGVPRALPSLLRAEKIGKRAARAGFDWKSAAQVLDKVEEELHEARAALAQGELHHAGRELGDLFFAAAQAARFLDVNPEEASRAAVDKFEARFRHLEAALAKQGKTPKDVDDAELDRLWEQAKAALKNG